MASFTHTVPSNAATYGDGTYHASDPTAAADAAPFTVSGTVAKGNTITVSRAAGGFGTKTQAAPGLWLFGSDCYENGTVNTTLTAKVDGNAFPAGSAGDIFASKGGDTTVSTSSLRHGDLDMQIRGVGTNGAEAGWVGWPNAYLGTENDKTTGVSGDKLYIAFRYKSTHDNFNVRRVGYLNLASGPFNDGATDFDVGEAATVSGGKGTINIIKVDTGNNYIHFVTPGGLGSSDLTGESLTGDSTSATLDFDVAVGAKYQNAGSGKPCRIWQTTSTSETNIRISHANYGQIITTQYDSSGTYQGEAATTVTGPDPVNDANWKLLEYWVDFSGATGTVTMIMDGTEYTQTGIDLTYKNGSHMPQLANCGLDQSPEANTEVFWGEIYVDTVRKHFVIGDAATWTACDKSALEYVRPTSWSDTSVQFVQFHGTGYLYFIQEDGTVLSENGVAYS